ncbi:ADP-ribosylglycohydrolase family protein [Candidatus Uabimicrobium sp. HlEnr_7]|uniref:ADP-ribosylglycohydrolase family protein n=1 Tax=Candidatus Uabimicrobium helgolandensis TaxID=3095367 RepID=UPI003558426E
MNTHHNILANLFSNKQIDILHGKLLNETPTKIAVDFDRITGMIWGVAIGDALGFPTEGLLPDRRKKRHGDITSYTKNIGSVSDDTQLTMWTLEQMIADQEFIPENIAAKFCEGNIIGMGQTVRGFRKNFKQGLPWYECGPKSAGNGALMRIAPIIIPHINDSALLWKNTTLLAMMTHNDSGSISACLAFVYMLRELLQMSKPPRSRWWLDTYVEIAKQFERDASYRPRGGSFRGYHGTIYSFAKKRIAEAKEKDLSVLDACNSWYSGAYLLETVPSVIYILTKYGNDPQQAITRAATDTKDNDTIAAIVGAAMGALHGKKSFPQKWIENHCGRADVHSPLIEETLQKAQELWTL